jgi:hypothetical protein
VVDGAQSNTRRGQRRLNQITKPKNGEKKMKARAIVTLGLISFVGAAPYSALANPLKSIEGLYSNRLIEKVSCDTRNEDKQALCMRACDDAWIKATQAYNANIDNAKVQKKECESKCGC